MILEQPSIKSSKALGDSSFSQLLMLNGTNPFGIFGMLLRLLLLKIYQKRISFLSNIRIHEHTHLYFQPMVLQGRNI